MFFKEIYGDQFRKFELGFWRFRRLRVKFEG